MKKYIRMILVFVVFMLYSRFSTAVPASLDCMGNDGTWHVLSNDPQNGTNIVVDQVVYRFGTESLIGNKKVSTYKTDAGTIANVILIVDPSTKEGNIFIVIYQDASNKRDQDIDKLNIHCEL